MSSWFYKLRRKRRGGGTAIAGAEPDDVARPVAPAPSPCSPNRASYYVPSRERAVPPRPAMEDNPKLRDTHFPRSPRPSDDIVFDSVARRDDHRFKPMPMPELKLRPILTRHNAASADSTSAAASPTARVRPRFHARPTVEEEEEACARRSRRRSASRLRAWMYESLVVVKDSVDPEEDFLESMTEMIAAANGVRPPRGLEELLACYLALNAPDHHRAIVAAFRRAWVRCTCTCTPCRHRRRRRGDAACTSRD